jgi:hypothetical protein
MTDHIRSITVVVEDMRDDDAESLISAIKQIRGVISATGNVVDLHDFVAYETARNDLTKKLWGVLSPKWAREKKKE